MLTAPISGTITQISGLQKGSFALPNQTVGYISPKGSLLVECYISPHDIGLIRDSMPVKFQYDAYNYNQWGIGSGHIYSISNDVTFINEQPFFKVRCTMNEHQLFLKNGFVGNLKKGMTLTGRFVVTQRSLYQLLFDKVDNWLNPKIRNG